MLGDDPAAIVMQRMPAFTGRADGTDISSEALAERDLDSRF